MCAMLRILYGILLVLCSAALTIDAAEDAKIVRSPYVIIRESRKPPMYQPTQSELSEIHESRFRDLSSSQHVSNRWRQHSYNTGHYSVAALFTDHEQCARWSELDYVYALVTLCSQALPHGHRCALPSTMKPFCSDDKNIYYIDDAQRFNVFEQWKLYDYENFWQFIRHFSDYEQCICSVYDFFVEHPQYQQLLSQYALQRISRERNDIKCREQAQHIQQERDQQQVIQRTYQEHAEAIDDEQGYWHELCDVYDHYGLGDGARLEKRIDALREINSSGAVYTRTQHNLDAAVVQLLQSSGCNGDDYTCCYGNQLQQVVHGECLDILGHVASPSISLIIEKDVVVDCVDAAREYNQSGLVHKACQVADMCWSMLDYGRAVLAHVASRVASHSPDIIANVAAGVKDIVVHPAQYIDAVGDGLGKGLYCAVSDIFNHPVQTVAYAVAGQYILEYHLSKVFFDLCDISIMALLDRDRARKKWDDYIAPLTAVINTIADKKTTLRDAVENGTALVIGWKAQAKLLDGMGNLYRSVKDKALEWIRNNPLADPERYMMTADGALFKALDNFEKHHNNIVNKSNIRFSPGALDQVLLLLALRRQLTRCTYRMMMFIISLLYWRRLKLTDA